MARPYQPSLLRILHGAVAVLVPAAWISGLVVYSLHDGRWGRLPWHPGGDWIDIHGSFGVLLWPLAIAFGLYALTLGRARLRQPENGAALLGLALAVGSGKLMSEDWLRQGELQEATYGLHLLAWLLIGAAVLWHVSGVLRRGGLPLARSMASLQARANDRPGHWPGQIARFFRRPG
ncbi:cytochrome b/b6 domain-containing protein [Vulcanococcus limneticus]|uniref:cytochrome b/b6 domain-containing protein n=1 Tax=Vulcanococcus limneticus TaxID=2170428 RepID=UPI00398BE5FF